MFPQKIWLEVSENSIPEDFDFPGGDDPEPVEPEVPANFDILIGDVGGQVLNDDFHQDIVA